MTWYGMVTFWNDCTSVTDSKVKVTQHQIRTIASVNNENLELPEKLPIEEFAKQAFLKLGNGGIIGPGKEH